VKRNLLIGATFVAILIALAIGQNLVEQKAMAQAKTAAQAPVFEVDPFWPKPMPNNWVFGQTIGLGIDEKDTVWIIHRGNDPGNLDNTEYAFPPAGGRGGAGRGGAAAGGAAPGGAPAGGAAAGGAPAGAAGAGARGAEAPATSKPNRVSECCVPAPPVMAFDQAGNVVHSWGGPSVTPEWPDSNHGIVVDHKGFVWIGGNGGPDQHILKFTREGKLVAEFGKKGARMKDGQPVRDSNDMNNFGRVAKIFIEPKANEAYVADGYFNRRVAVVDMDSGKIKRYWGGSGEKPDDGELPPYDPKSPPIKAFRNPVHCAEVSNDGFVYVCDRPNDRLQVFTKEGKFVKEKQFFPETRSDGSVWDVAFSKDPQQRWLYMADGANEHVYIIDRQSLEVVSHFGYGGRQPGMFFGVHSIAVDSKGNIYTTETYTGKRLQKFVYKGMGPAKTDHGPTSVAWPSKPTN
jgi:DNA-binding beta-propeller fold protein YncE